MTTEETVIDPQILPLQEKLNGIQQIVNILVGLLLNAADSKKRSDVLQILSAIATSLVKEEKV